MKTRSIATVMVCGAALVAAGCATRHNGDPTLGGAVTLEFLEPTPDAGATPDPAPSVAGLSREHWGRTVVLVPVDGTVHLPPYSVHPRFADATARQRWEYPTADTVLEGSTCCGSRQLALEGLASPFYSALDLLLILPRSMDAAPWARVKSPSRGGPRLPAAQRAPISGNAVIAQPMPPGENSL